MDTAQVQYVHDYVSDKETFEEMKALQIKVGQEVRLWKSTYRQAQREGIRFYTTQPDYSVKSLVPRPSVDARLHNIAYALVRGKAYSQVENPRTKPKYDGEVIRVISRIEIQKYLTAYPGVDQSKIKWEGLE